MDRRLSHQIRQNRVKAMAVIGASPDAWAEVLLLPDVLPDQREALAHLQSWCWRSAEEAENRRVIEKADEWAAALIYSANKAHQEVKSCDQKASDDPQKLQSEVAWIESQVAHTPPPDRSPEWSLRISLLDLVCYCVVESHPCFDPLDWRDLIIQVLQYEVSRQDPEKKTPQSLQHIKNEIGKALGLNEEALKATLHPPIG